ncbi:MAG: relaxase domain-containing protein [Candidatus Latescibacteria bacterium]|nr:relaxase domain-containing protein [Candidatus Latescibacterota bacterium]
MQYFEADSYYAKESKHGVWFGKCVGELELDESINRDQFRRILEGYDLQGNPLVRNADKGNRRSYVDFTFSCPKSVSILSYTDDRIEQFHSIAVTKALETIQNSFAITREGAGGCRSYRTGNLLAARFNHHESRELDPQLHTHCVIMNMTKGRDGKYRALEMGEMFKNQLFIGQVYRNQLAVELQKLGYRIDVTERHKGLFEIAGVDRSIIDEFSTRRKQIEKILKEQPENEFERQGKRAEVACLMSRKRKKETDIEIIRERAQERLLQLGSSLETVRETALHESASQNDERELTIHDCIRMALEDITEQHSAFRKEIVTTLALKIGLGRFSAEEIGVAFNEFEELIHIGNRNLYVGKTISPDIQYYSTKEIENVERGIVQLARNNCGTSSVNVSGEAVTEYLREIEGSGIELSRGQQDAVRTVCTSENFLGLIQGDAGSGKTFAVEHIRKLMEHYGHEVRGFAPTGKAAVELQSAGITTSTVDSYFESSKSDIKSGELWIVDESGMIGSRKLFRFLKEAEKHQAKVILIGDSKQFMAVDQGKMFSDLQRHPATSYAEITENKRQQTAHMKAIVGEFKKRSPEGVRRAFDNMKNFGCIEKIVNRESRLAKVAIDYLNDREDNIQSLVLASTNADRHELNRNIRLALVDKGLVRKGYEHDVLQSAGHSGNMRRFANNYRPGQRIFFQKKSGEIKKGTSATITDVNVQENTLTIEYTDKKTLNVVSTTIDLFDEASKIQAFNVHRRSFGVGDTIITLKNDRRLRVENGKIGTIKSIDSYGNVAVLFNRRKIRSQDSVFTMNLTSTEVTAVFQADIGSVIKGTECRVIAADRKTGEVSVEFSAENERQHTVVRKEDLGCVELFQDTTCRFNLKNYQYCDHAYSVTSYKSQGCTLDSVRILHDQTHGTNYNEMYVSVTRARKNAVIYTDNYDRLVDQAVREQQKDSVLDFSSSVMPKDPFSQNKVDIEHDDLISTPFPAVEKKDPTKTPVELSLI